MSCFRLSKTNGEVSHLFAKLYEILPDEQAAEKLYNYFDEEVIKIFGNYRAPLQAVLNDPGMRDRVDVNGEPKLFLNTKLNKHYFIDKNQEPIFYPYTRQGLGGIFETNEIKLFAKTAALKFFEANIEFNFETLELNNKQNQTLRTFVEDFVQQKATSLMSNPDPDKMVKGFALKATESKIDEWVEEVKSYFTSLKIDYSSETEELEEQEEELRGGVGRKESFLKSNKNNINNNVKLFLSLIKSNTLNDFDEYTFINFDDIYSTLNKILSNKVAIQSENGLEDLYEIFLSEILKASKVKPYLVDLHTNLSGGNVSDTFKHQFTGAFNLFKKNYLGSERATNEKGEIDYSVRNLSEVGSRKTSIILQWLYNYNEIVTNTGQLQFIKQESQKKSINYTNASKNLNTEESLIPFLNDVKDLLNKLGVEFTQEGFDYYLTNFGQDLDLNSKKQRLGTTISNIVRAIDFKLANEDKNLFLNQKIFKQIAEAEAFFMEEGSDAAIFTLGKTKWAYSLPSYLDLKVAQWKKDPSLLERHYNATPYNKGSHYMEFFLALDFPANTRQAESKRRLNDIEVGVFNSIQQQGDSLNASDNKNLSYTDSLVDYLHKILAFKKGDKVWHKTALAADKSTEYQIHYGNDGNFFNLSTNAVGQVVDDNIEILVNNDVLEVFYKYFKSEYDRIAYEYKVIEDDNIEDSKLLPNYHLGSKNALVSQLFPSLAVTFTEYGIEQPNIDLALYDKNGKPLFENLDQIREDVKKLISKKLGEGIRKTYEKLFDNGIFSYDEMGKKVNNAIDSSIYNAYVSESNQNKAPLRIAADMFVNSVMSQVEYAKMFTGDVAFYKNTNDYKKRVPATYTDGLYMRLLAGEEKFNVSIIEPVEVPSPSLEELKKILPPEIYEKYKEVNSTDAQAWITPQRWLFIMERLGKNIPTEMYDKFFQANPVFSNKELKILAQPLKGVYFDVIDGKPAYLKYSQAVLLPNLIKNTPLEKLYNKMVLDEKGKLLPYQNQIHELIARDGMKVGYPIPERTHTEEGDILNDFRLNKVQLNNASWKLQQDLPVKGVKPTDVGSQIQKNIYQGLVFNLEEDFYIEDKTYTGDELIDHINEIIGTMSSKGLGGLLNRLGVDPSTKRITNEDVLYQSLISQLKKRSDVPDNFIKALEAGISPYGIPGAFQMFQNAFSSLVNGNTVKIKTNGGGFIQMADYGLSKTEAEGKGVLFTPWFEGSKLHAPKITIHPETGRETISPGGVFISGSMIAKYVPDYRKYSSEELFGTLNTITNKYEGGIIDQEILTNLIGYRIPNSGLPSNDALQVLGILPEGMGNTVVAYNGITKKTGSDFDIDMMYLMLASMTPIYNKADVASARAYLEEEGLTDEEIKDELYGVGYEDAESMTASLAINQFIDDILLGGDTESLYYDDFRERKSIGSVKRLRYAKPAVDKNGIEYPLYQQSLKVLQNKLIEAYKSVLTSKHTIADVMNPIDDDYIENDIKNLYPDEKRDDLLDFDAITDLEIKNEFMMGKAGLGQNVNSLVDAVRGAMGDLFFNDLNLGWGITNSDGNTSFDAQYSEELSPKEIKEYITSYNKTVTGDDQITAADMEKLKQVKLGESMMVLVNGFVDIANNPYIVKGNWVTQTNNLGFMLLRAGVHPFKVNAFLGQPVLKEYVAFKNNKESKTIDDTNNIEDSFRLRKASEKFNKDEKATINGLTYTKRNIFDSILTPSKVSRLVNSEPQKYEGNKTTFVRDVKIALLEKFNVPAESLKSDNPMVEDFKVLTNELMEAFDSVFNAELRDFSTITLNELRDEVKIDTDVSIQLSILDKYLEWQVHAKKLTKNVNASKVDVSGKGKNIVSLITAVNKIRNILKKSELPGELNGFTTKLYRNGKDTILNSYIKNSLTAPYEIMRANPKFFLTASNNVISTFNIISDHIYQESLTNDKLADKLEKAYYSFVMSGFTPFVMSNEEKTSLLEGMPKRINELKKTENLDNALINELVIKPSDKKDKYFVTMPNVKKSTSFKNTLTDSWKDLLESHPEMAEDLIKYSFLITGFNNNINQFHEFIPYEWFNKNRFNSYLKTVGDNQEKIDRVFINQFFRNNYEDNVSTKRVFQNQMQTLAPGDGFQTGFILKETNETAPYLVKYIQETIHGETVKYFKFEGMSSGGQAVYTRTSLLGFKDNRANRVFEYNMNHTSVNTPSMSMFPSNQVKSTFVNTTLLKQIRDNFQGAEEYKEGLIESDETPTIQQEVDSIEQTGTPEIVEDIATNEPQVLPEENELKQKIQELNLTEKDITLSKKRGDVTYVNPVTKNNIVLDAYNINIKGHPNTNIVATNLDLDYAPENMEDGTYRHMSKGRKWFIVDLTTGMNFPVKVGTRAEIAEGLLNSINKAEAQPQTKKILKDIGFDFSDENCK
tara:strand:+ start:26251 stop:33438 length:7188 start_codon:yes stop_codon:yes gene_type:complete